MSTNQTNSNQPSQNQNTDTSNTQNNNGTIGREVEEEKKSTGSFKDIGKDKDTQKTANDDGIAENDENHWSDDADKNPSGYAADEEDPNDTRSTKNTPDYPKRGYNHVDNAGGTSQEEMEEGRSGINISDKDEEDLSDADGSRL